jgi:hypothetical protein
LAVGASVCEAQGPIAADDTTKEHGSNEAVNIDRRILVRKLSKDKHKVRERSGEEGGFQGQGNGWGLHELVNGDVGLQPLGNAGEGGIGASDPENTRGADICGACHGILWRAVPTYQPLA